MSKADLFLSQNLNPQGWLTDFISAQVNRDDLKDLHKFLYSVRANPAGNKIFSLNPKYKNKFMKGHLPKAVNKGTGDPEKDRKTRLKYVNFMLNVTPAQIAAMQPYIRLYVRKSDGKKEEISFKKYTDIDFITQRKLPKDKQAEFVRGDGAGIKSLTVTRKYPKAGFIDAFEMKIEFFFQSLAYFANGGTKKNQYFDLFKTRVNRDDDVLILEYGYNVDSWNTLIPMGIKDTINTQEKKSFAISWTNHQFSFDETGAVTLTIDYIGSLTHNIFSEDGGFFKGTASFLKEVSVTKADTSTAKELQTAEENLKTKEALYQKEVKDLQRAGIQAVANHDTDKKVKLEKSMAETRKTIQRLRLQVSEHLVNQIITKIMKNFQLFQVQLKSSINPSGNDFSFGVDADIKRVTDKPESPSLSQIPASVQTAASAAGVLKLFEHKIRGERYTAQKALDRIEKDWAGINTNNIRRILNTLITPFTYAFADPEPYPPAGTAADPYGNFLFFPLRALFEVLYEMRGDKKAELPFLCLDNMLINSLGEEVWINIGDVLIETSVFEKWLFNLVVQRNMLAASFGDIVKNIFEKLVPEAVSYNRTGTREPSNPGLIKFTTHDVSKKWSSGGTVHKGTLSALQSELREKANLDNLHILATEYKEEGSEALIHAEFRTSEDLRASSVAALATTTLSKILFDGTVDHEAGLYHLNIGDSRGLLKKISFSADDLEKVRTAIWLGNKDSAAAYLKFTYSSNITLVGNNIFMQSGFFVIPNNPLGISKEEDPGISGYYIMDSIVDRLAPGVYDTQITGRNVYSSLDHVIAQKIIKRDKIKPKIYNTYVQQSIYNYINNMFLRTHAKEYYKINKKEEAEKQQLAELTTQTGRYKGPMA